jgi:hypothetical protein
MLKFVILNLSMEASKLEYHPFTISKTQSGISCSDGLWAAIDNGCAHKIDGTWFLEGEHGSLVLPKVNWNLSKSTVRNRKIQSPTKFVKKLVRGELSYGEQECYWTFVACDGNFSRYLSNVSNCWTHNWSAREVQFYQDSYKAHRRCFEHKQQDMFMSLTNAPDKCVLHRSYSGHKSDRKIKNMLEAQSLFSIEHKLSGDIMTHISTVVDSLSGFMNRSNFNGLRATLIRFIIVLFELCSDSSLMSKIRSLMSFLVDFDWSSFIFTINDYAQALAQVFKTLTNQMYNRLVAQADFLPFENIVLGTTKLLASMLSVDHPSDVKVNSGRVKRLKELADTVTSLEKLWNFIHRLFGESLDQLLESFGVLSPMPEVIKMIDSEIPEWMDAVNNITTGESFGLIGQNVAVGFEVIDLKKRGDQYMIDLQKAKASPAVVSYFLQAYNVIKKAALIAVPHYFTDKMRESPFVLHLYGNSGVGKSTVQNFLVKELMEKMNFPFNPARDVYVRNNTQDHWDGYSNQPVVVLDDFMQIRDAEVIQCELSELVHIKNTTPYPLKMASLENKGCTRFTSKLVVLSSNADFGADLGNYVAAPTAIKRRRDVVARVLIRSSVADSHGKLDTSKLDDTSVRFDPTIYGFHVDGHTGIMNYPKFVEFCLGVWEKSIHEDAALVDTLPNWTGVDFPALVEDISFFDDRKLEAQALFGKTVTFEELDEVDQSIMEYALTLDDPMLPDTWSSSIVALYHTLKSKCSDVASNGTKRFSEAVVQWKERIEQKIGTYTWYQIGLRIVGAIGLMGTTYALFRSVERPESESNVSGDNKTQSYRRRIVQFKPESNVSGDQKTKKYVRRLRFDNPAGSAVSEAAIDRTLYDGVMWSGDSLECQGSSDPSAHTIIANCVYNNLARVTLGGCTTNGLFICDAVLVIPHHILEFFKQAVTMRIETRALTIDLDPNDCDVVADEPNDVAFIKCPINQTGTFVSLLKHFHDLAAVEKVCLDAGVLCTTREVKDKAEMMMMMCHNLNVRGRTQYSALQSGDDVVLARGYGYFTQSQKGDCGSPIVALHPGMQRKILGIHVAGGMNHGVCNIMTRDYLYKVLDKFLVKPMLIEVPELNPDRIELTAHSSVCHEDKVEVFGSVNPALQFRNPSISELEKSAIYGVYDPITAPSLLSTVGGVNPMRIGVEPQFIDPIVFPQSIVDEAVDDLAISMCSMYSPYKKMKVLPEDAILNGLDGDPWICPMNLKTSPGFPFIHIKRNKPGKFDFIEGDVGSYKLGEFAQRLVDRRERKAADCVVPFTLFCDTLKDERRSFEKVADGKTRVFNTAPFDLNFLVRKYFLPFIAHLMYNHIEGECSIGINPHSDDWSHFFNHLMDKGDNWIAGDFSKYDKRLPFQLIMGALTVINRFFKDDNDDIRKSLFVTMFNAFHLNGKTVYRVHQGNPSGVPITGMINSMVNSLLSRISFKLIARDLGKCVDMNTFNRYVRVKNFGDDNIGRVDNIVSWYNMKSISKCLAKYGVKYTSPTKEDGMVSEYLELPRVSYLKRTFDKRDGKVWAPLDITVVQEMLNWRRTGGGLTPHESTVATYRSAMGEMVHYGREKFRQFQTHVQDFATDREIRLPVYGFDVLMHEMTETVGCDLALHETLEV